MNKFKCWGLSAVLLASSMGFVSCNDDDDDNTANPVEESVLAGKKHDTALLLCTFGSTFRESIKTYDQVLADYKNEPAFKDCDVYLAFTSRTCVNRVFAETGVERFQPDFWLDAFGKAGYKRVAVQSLHVIPGEEYLSLMNTDVKKNFMASAWPDIEVVKGTPLLFEQEDIEAVADALFAHYQTKLADKNQVVLLMGHGNPDKLYVANDRYTLLEEALLKRAANKNIFVGTVDYGNMLFYTDQDGDGKEDVTCVYAKLKKYCADKGVEPAAIEISMAPLMSIAGDHAHNDMWGIEDGDDFSKATPEANACWRLKLLKMGFRINEDESHHGGLDKCTVPGLADNAMIRAVWLKHMKSLFEENAWESWNEHLE